MRERFGQLRTIVRVVRLFPIAHRGITVVYWISVAVKAALPIAAILATTNLARISAGILLDGSGAPGGAFAEVFPAVLLVAALYLFQQVVGPLSYWVNDTLGEKLSEYWRERVMDAALTPSGISHLENPGSADRLWLAAGLDQRSFAPARVVSAVADILNWRLRGFASAFLLIPFGWWMPILLIITWLPLWYVIAARTQIQMTNAEHGSYDLRRSAYFRNTAMDTGAAKEIRLFRIGEWILDNLDRHYNLGSKEMWRDRGFTRWAFVPCILAPAVVSSLILILAVGRAISGSLTIPDITLITLAIIGAQNIGKSMAWWTRSFFGAGAVASGMELGDLAGYPQASILGKADLNDPPELIVFDQVGFSYPGTSITVLDGLELELQRGRSAAVVGPNGAGKTTLVKLLARLYDPQRGSISVDGIKLTDISPESWRSKIAIIFQDFVRYEMSLSDNISVGSIENRTNQMLISSAAEKAGMEKILGELEYSYETVLARGYSKSRYLSGGEWQRVALARAFAAVEGGAQILVLDEPTANLDVDAEASFFDRFLELTAGLTTVLITHRMASVRHVDKIFVLDGKRIIEAGSHSQLMKAGGVYANMFELQASQFAEREDG